MVGRSVPPVGMLKVETLTFVHVGGRGSTGVRLAGERREASEEIVERTTNKLRQPHDGNEKRPAGLCTTGRSPCLSVRSGDAYVCFAVERSRGGGRPDAYGKGNRQPCHYGSSRPVNRHY
jgi:hypothetical protein